MEEGTEKFIFIFFGDLPATLFFMISPYCTPAGTLIWLSPFLELTETMQPRTASSTLISTSFCAYSLWL